MRDLNGIAQFIAAENLDTVWNGMAAMLSALPPRRFRRFRSCYPLSSASRTVDMAMNMRVGHDGKGRNPMRS